MLKNELRVWSVCYNIVTRNKHHNLINMKMKTIKKSDVKNASVNNSVKATAKKAVKKSAAKVQEAVVNSTDLGKKLIAKMRRGAVQFTFINRLGKQITTVGTLIKERIPTTRKVAGAIKARDKDHVVFYDLKHGVRRQFNRNQVVAILA